MSNIAFRPHHFLCALCFQGKGYSPKFIENFTAIMQQLNAAEGDAVQIEVVAETDSICHPCPHRREKKCTSQDKILQLDQAHAAILKLRSGDILTWGEAKQRIKQFMAIEHFHKACEPCEWKKLGICEMTLVSLQNTSVHDKKFNK